MNYRSLFGTWVLIGLGSTQLMAQAVEATTVPFTPASSIQINRWYHNYYEPASQGRANVQEKAQEASDSTRVVNAKPDLTSVGRPVYVYMGGNYDQVAWLDKKGNSMGTTFTPTYYTNTLPNRPIHRDSFNPWGAGDVQTALLFGGLNYAINGFKTPDYRTQKFYLAPSNISAPIPLW